MAGWEVGGGRLQEVLGVSAGVGRLGDGVGKTELHLDEDELLRERAPGWVVW